MLNPQSTEVQSPVMRSGLKRLADQAAALREIRTSLMVPIPVAGRACGVGRDASYRAAAAGDLPTVRFGRELKVPSAKLLEMLGLPIPAELLGQSTALMPIPVEQVT